MKLGSRAGTRLVALLVLAATLLTVTNAAAADKEKIKIRLTAAGQAAARAVMLRGSDLAPATGWTGETRKPDSSTETPCSSFHPKQSDLVLIGNAEVMWKNPAGAGLDSEAEVYRTARMVQLEWQRVVSSPHLLECLREASVTETKSLPVRIVSLRRIGFPRVADRATGVRLVVSIKRPSGTILMVSDDVFVAERRTLISLLATTALASKNVLRQAEIRLVRRLVARVRA